MSSARKRTELRELIYSYLQEHFENARRKEELAILNKSASKRRGKLTPPALAADVFATIEKEHPLLLQSYRELSRQDGYVAVEGVRIPGDGRVDVVDDLLMTGVRSSRGRKKAELVSTRSSDQAVLALKIIELGEGGRHHFLPIETAIIKEQVKRIDAVLAERRSRVRDLIEARTSDPDLGQRAFDLVMARF